jgi:phage baseplate assembly protein W
LGYLYTQSDVNQIKADLLILLLTSPGERVMLPNFGTPLKTILFEPNDAIVIAQATQMISNAISTWEPRVAISALNVTTGTSNLNQNDFVTPNVPTGVGLIGGTTSYTQNDDDHCLSIQIKFFDPENIQSIQELVFEVPLS